MHPFSLRVSASVFLLFSTCRLSAQTGTDSLKKDSTKAMQLESVTILSDRIIDRSSVSDLSLNPAEIKISQGLYEDPLRSISFLPGISKGGGDLFSTSQIYVRGGSPDENLYMLDNVRLYFPWYFGGIKSIFNTETIDHLEILTGGFSAKYGNAMSSILNVSTRHGNFERYHGNVSVGFANSQLLLEGPLLKNKVSFLVSARKTYLDLFIKNPKQFPLSSFTDATYILSWKINEKQKLIFSGISGLNGTTYHVDNPAPGVPGTIDNKGNVHSQSLQWQALFGSRLYSKLSLLHSFSSSQVTVGRNFNLDITGETIGFRQDFSWYFRPDYKIIFGGEWAEGGYSSTGNTPLDPFSLDPADTNITLYSFDINSRNQNHGAYASLLGKSGRFNVNAGGRYDYNKATGGMDLSPRLSLSYNLTERSRLRAAWGYYYQFPGMDAVNRNNKLTSSRCTHYILGYSQNFGSQLTGWIEGYHKQYEQLVVYDSLLNYSNSGTGYSQGAEVFLSKKMGLFSGWLSYGYSVSKRRESLQQKEAYFVFDQRHIFNTVVEMNVPNKDKFYIPHLVSLNFTYRTGTPYTPVNSAVLTPGGWQQIKGEPFSLRNPASHNLILKVQFRVWINKRKTIRMYSFIEIWNLYNRKNVAGRLYQYGSQYPNNVSEQVYYGTPFLQAGGFKLEF